MKRGKVESILLIAVLALSMQVESYSVAISNREQNQIYNNNSIEERVADTIVTRYRTVNGNVRKGGGIKQKTDGKIRHGKTYDELMQ